MNSVQEVAGVLSSIAAIPASVSNDYQLFYLLVWNYYQQVEAVFLS